MAAIFLICCMHIYNYASSNKFCLRNSSTFPEILFLVYGLEVKYFMLWFKLFQTEINSILCQTENLLNMLNV